MSGISVIKLSGLSLVNTSSFRITTTDTSGLTQSSTITITGLTTSDNAGTIQCIDLADNSVQGMASISVGEWYFREYIDINYYLECMQFIAVILVLWYV